MDKYGKHIYNRPDIFKSYPDYNTVEIGNFVSFAAGVTFKFLGQHSMKSTSTYAFLDFPGFPHKEDNINNKNINIIVGNDVWFGQGAIVLQGSIIGDGAVIGAHSVVRGWIPPYSIVVGNPAVTRNKRFSDEEIEELLKIKWWDWDDDKIQRNLPLLINKLDINALKGAV